MSNSLAVSLRFTSNSLQFTLSLAMAGAEQSTKNGWELLFCSLSWSEKNFSCFFFKLNSQFWEKYIKFSQVFKKSQVFHNKIPQKYFSGNLLSWIHRAREQLSFRFYSFFAPALATVYSCYGVEADLLSCSLSWYLEIQL